MTVGRAYAALLGALIFGASVAHAQAPRVVPIQGFLTDENDRAIDEAQSLTFRVFDQEAEGTSLFEETQEVLVERGFFTAYVGDDTAFPLDLFAANSMLWVEIEVAGEVLSPRVQLGTTPYAGFAEATGSIDWTDIDNRPGGLDDGDDVGAGSLSMGPGIIINPDNNSIRVDPTFVQRRVAIACEAGEAITGIGMDGGATCAPFGDIDAVVAGNGLAGGGTEGEVTLRINFNSAQARFQNACDTTGEFITGVDAAGQVTCENVFAGASFAQVHFGNEARTGQANGWQPDTPRSAPTLTTQNGVFFEGGTTESGGFFANGDTAVIWSPGDGNIDLDTGGGTRVGSVLLAIHDEDGIIGTTPRTSNAEFTFANAGLRSFGTFTGAYLSLGGVWVNSSARDRKHGVEEIDPEVVLSRLADLPIYEWSYDAEREEGYRHLGPMADEFRAAFGVGYDDATIPTVDADGVALVSIQALRDRNEALRREVEELRTEVARLRELEERLARLEEVVGERLSR
ncbi:MAG: tail fiber domain-containing protein [Sandaracinaceae bacterium]